MNLLLKLSVVQITVGAPGWLAGFSGTAGFHGVNTNVDVGMGQILKHINVIYSFGGEVRKGRFGVLGDLLYLNAQAGTGERSGLVSKVDLGLQQFLGEFFGSYRSFSFYDDWFDPVIGLRGRFNLNKAFYLTVESDVGGFGIGSDIALQEYAALGCQITRNIFPEVGYRYLYDDFRDTNFLYQMSLHGAQITVEINF
jgi:hypothetical protein